MCVNYDCDAKQFMALGLPLEGREVEYAKLDISATAGRSGLGDNVAFSTLGPRWLGTRAASSIAEGSLSGVCSSDRLQQK